MGAIVGALPPDVWWTAAAIVFGIAVAAILWLGNRHPVIGITLGLAFLAVPVAVVMFLSRENFRSEGSAAGLVIFVFVAGVGFTCGALGLILLAKGFANYVRGAPSSRRALAIFLGVIAIGVLAGAARWYEGYRARTPLFVSSPEERLAVRQVEVRDRDAFTWKRRGLWMPMRVGAKAGQSQSSGLAGVAI